METLINYFVNVLQLISSTVDWVYLLFLIITGYVVIRMVKLEKKYPKLKTRWQILIIGILLAVVFAICKNKWGLPWHSTAKMPYGFVLFFSFVVGQFLNLYSLEYIVEKYLIPFGKKLWKKITGN